MSQSEQRITISHGSGGRKSRELVEKLFQRYFSNPVLDRMDDSAVLELSPGRTAFTTDSFVVKPLFFDGGDIGRLAVCGTVNDLSVMGARPEAITVAFILEEGLDTGILERIVSSMSQAAEEAGVKVVAGDTKVVEKGMADGIYINTSGIGVLPHNTNIGGAMAKPGDVILINGAVGNHGASVITAREELGFKSTVKSDAAPLNHLIEEILQTTDRVHVMRDATRGGLATVLNEISLQSGVDIEVFENRIYIQDEVRGVCELLGFDPLYLANEGKIVVFVPEDTAEEVLQKMKKNRYGRDSCIIGRVVDNSIKPVVTLKTAGRGSRFLDMLAGEPLPRIC